MAYDCPYTMKTYILTARNAVHIHSMSHNIIPPFVMYEAGLRVNDVPRIHTKPDKLKNKMHSIVATEADNRVILKTPLKLGKIFSYFPTRKLT